MVHTELEALAVKALLGRACSAVHLRGVAGVCVSKHKLAHVVQQGRAEQLVATACRRKRSGITSQPGVRSKKSKVVLRAASVSTPSGDSTSTASGMLAILPFLRCAERLAMRRTVITSATSDSTAATTSPTEVWSSRTTRSTRLRDSARAGKASSAWKAAVRRRPWPSLCRLTTDSALLGLLMADGRIVL
jgi:hypothetical protein